MITRHFLRKALIADAAISGTTGLAMMLGADMLATLLGVPALLLRYAGLILLPFAALLVVLATRENVHRGAVRAVIVANVLWAIDSIVLLFTGWVDPSALGYAFIVFQAVIVAAFAEVQHVGLKMVAPTPAHAS
jgi:hypothetical protein